MLRDVVMLHAVITHAQRPKPSRSVSKSNFRHATRLTACITSSTSSARCTTARIAAHHRLMPQQQHDEGFVIGIGVVHTLNTSAEAEV